MTLTGWANAAAFPPRLHWSKRPALAVEEALAVVAEGWRLAELVAMLKIDHEAVLVSAVIQSEGVPQLMEHEFAHVLRGLPFVRFRHHRRDDS